MPTDLAIDEKCVCGALSIPVGGSGRGSKWCRPHMIWAHQIRHRYGLDDETIDALLVLRSDGCSICGSHHLLSIDHCHSTGMVRGWLCRKCNSALGFLNDDIERLRAALRYLEGI